MARKSKDARSTYHPRFGITRLEDDPTIRKNVISPPSNHPLREGLRFDLSMRTLGKLERLAKARFQIRELTSVDLADWRKLPDRFHAVAQTVSASSEIEGEAISARELELVIAAVTEAQNGRSTPELSQRAAGVKDIYETMLWALTTDRQSFVTTEFLKELHTKMFRNTHPGIAGRIKERPIAIKGAGYYIETVPPDRTEGLLLELCKRVEKQFQDGRTNAEASMFLTTAEFVCDFLAIHPFADGNGRTARVLSTYLLERAGYHFARFYSVDSLILETRAQYYDALFRGQRRWYEVDEDLTPWVEYYTDTVYEQWRRAYQRVRDERSKGTIPE